MINALVTGATGFVGSSVVRQALKKAVDWFQTQSGR
jgi:uncharacterized protein YbjT (DUF2867 family)